METIIQLLVFLCLNECLNVAAAEFCLVGALISYSSVVGSLILYGKRVLLDSDDTYIYRSYYSIMIELH